MKDVSRKIESIDVLGYPIFTGVLSDLDLKKKKVISTINQYSYCIAEKDIEFKTALLKSDIILPDGIAIVAAGKLLSGQKIKKIAGADVHFYLLNELNKIGGTCFYMGSKESTLEKIKKKMSIEYTNVQVQTYSPPYKSKFNDSDNSKIIRAINDFSPDVLFIGLTAPKQEKWVNEHSHELEAKIICSIGAVFDFYAGTIVRPNKIWINLGLEWFVRLLAEPKRMWKRYLYYGPIFIISVLKEKMKN